MGGLPAAMPERLSVHVKETVTAVLFHPLAFANGVRVPVISGAVLSIFTDGELNVAELPALSVTVIEAEMPAPSAVSMRGLAEEVVSTPESPSLVVKGTLTFVLFQPAALARGLAAPNVTPGGVLSMLMPVLVACTLTLPALSVHVPAADCPLPSALRTTGAVQKSIPERLSAPVKLTFTLLLFQPFALAAGKAEATAVGGVRSILMPVTFTDAELPARSRHVPFAD